MPRKKPKKLSISELKKKIPKIVFYTDKISIRLKNLDSIAFWKEKFPKGKVRYC